jgi:hypothetical protein
MAKEPALPSLIDNVSGNTALAGLRQLLPHAGAWDVATGGFELGQLLTLEAAWHAVKKIRVLVGDETTRRTLRELQENLRRQSDDSIETLKERDDAATLAGLEVIRQALQNKALQLRAYHRSRFDARAQRVEPADGSRGHALIGSSSFTEAGLARPVTLSLATSDPDQVAALKAWFQKFWTEAEGVSPTFLALVERHLRLFTPFEIWAKALYEYCEGREVPLTEWEEKQSVVFPLLSKYQQDGYRTARGRSSATAPASARRTSPPCSWSITCIRASASSSSFPARPAASGRAAALTTPCT